MDAQDDFSQGEFSGAASDVVAGLREEYLADLVEKIGQLDTAIAQAPNDDESLVELTEEMCKFAFETKGQSHNFGLHMINTVAHRMADYFANIDCLSERHFADLRRFVECLSDIVEGSIPAETPAAEVVRDLPAKPGDRFEVGEVTVRSIEILLIMHHNAATRFIQRELQECGYRVSIVTNLFEALPLVLRTQPNMVLVSAVMGELSGTSFIAALKAMPETRNIPIALITSFERDHHDLSHLPESVPVIRKGASLGDDLTDALQQEFLL